MNREGQYPHNTHLEDPSNEMDYREEVESKEKVTGEDKKAADPASGDEKGENKEGTN